MHEPARSSEGDAAHDESGEMDEGDGVEASGEEAGDVALVSSQQQAGNRALELGDGGYGLGYASVEMRVELAGVSLPGVPAGRALPEQPRC